MADNDALRWSIKAIEGLAKGLLTVRGVNTCPRNIIPVAVLVKTLARASALIQGTVCPTKNLLGPGFLLSTVTNNTCTRITCDEWITFIALFAKVHKAISALGEKITRVPNERWINTKSSSKHAPSFIAQALEAYVLSRLAIISTIHTLCYNHRRRETFKKRVNTRTKVKEEEFRITSRPRGEHFRAYRFWSHGAAQRGTTAVVEAVREAAG
ncbi:hypothetical protein D6833_02255, partial [Candidatus Parcubacteria bacterium]